MKKGPKKGKPTGTIRSLNIVNTPSGMPLVLPEKAFSFPPSKDQAEEVAMKALHEELRLNYVQFKFDNYAKHPKEDGPDFDVIWDGQKAYVELTELAPLSGPYETARRVFTVKEMADLLVGLVEKKNSKYKDRGYSPLFLLIYVTDDAFYVAEEVLLVVAQMLQLISTLVFEGIFFVSFWADGRPHMRMPFPHHESLLLLDVQSYLEKQVINPSSSETKIVSTDPATNSIVVRQYLPRGAELSKLVDSVKAMLPGLEQALKDNKQP
jgi:hypothetical protein